MATSPLRWLVRLTLAALLIEAAWRLASLFGDGVEAGLSAYLLIGLTGILCAVLLIGEWTGTAESQARFALQLVILNGFLLVLGGLFWMQGGIESASLATGALRLAICAAILFHYRNFATEADG